MRLFLSAGEPSADRHAATLYPCLRNAFPEAEIESCGGPALRAAGAPVVHDYGRLQRVGLGGALAGIPSHVSLFRLLRRQFREGRYDLVILLDYPGFHLRVAGAARKAGVPVLYYIAPQLWAWGGWRAARLRRTVDRLAVVLPFEEQYFRSLGIAAEFVGHPIRDAAPRVTRQAARAGLGIDDDTSVLALFPGTRPAERARHEELFASAARYVSRAVPGVRVLLADRWGGPGSAQAHSSESVLAAADVVLCKAGTTTLEAALAGVPAIAAYLAHPVTYAVARRVVKVPWMSLANLVAGREVTPELIQGSATPERLADAIIPLLDRTGPAARSQREGLSEVRERLGGPGASQRVAALARELVA